MQLLPEETLKNPEALADVFKEMKAAYEKEKIPMNGEQTNLTISLLLSTDDKISGMYNDLNQHFPLNAFFARCNNMPIKYSKALLVWLGMVYLETKIGGLILIGYYLQWWIHDRTTHIPMDNDPISLDFVCEKVFPFGIFSKTTVQFVLVQTKSRGQTR